MLVEAFADTFALTTGNAMGRVVPPKAKIGDTRPTGAATGATVTA